MIIYQGQGDFTGFFLNKGRPHKKKVATEDTEDTEKSSNIRELINPFVLSPSVDSVSSVAMLF